MLVGGGGALFTGSCFKHVVTLRQWDNAKLSTPRRRRKISRSNGWPNVPLPDLLCEHTWIYTPSQFQRQKIEKVVIRFIFSHCINVTCDWISSTLLYPVSLIFGCRDRWSTQKSKYEWQRSSGWAINYWISHCTGISIWDSESMNTIWSSATFSNLCNNLLKL